MLGEARAIRIAILAMGGEGGGVLAGWIVDLAETNGWLAQQTSIPGVAQRTGATNYYVELFARTRLADGRSPVMALSPTPGDVDIVITSELMEAARAIQRGIVTPDRTTLVASSDRVYAMSERLAPGDGRVGEKDLIEAAQLAARRLVLCDMGRIAEETGSVISAVMLGALAGAEALPFDRSQFETTIERGGVGVAASKRGFARGFAAVRMSAREPEPEQPAAAGSVRGRAGRDALVDALRSLAPVAAHEVMEAALERLLDYQDEDYARLYLERLEPIIELDCKRGDGSFRLSTETARYLALGMAYEDTIRVAELKIRADRFARVAREVKAGEAQILKIAEFLHPRLQEIADSVPAPLGRFIERNTLARAVVGTMTRSGKIVETTSIRGFLLLYAVASLKGRRRASLRWAREQQSLDHWLSLIVATGAEDYALACEIAECRNLVKGYGDTHARGAAKYQRIIALLPRLDEHSEPARHVGLLRSAALAEESGARLEEAIDRLGLS